MSEVKDEAVGRAELEDELIEAARAFLDYLRGERSPTKAIAFPIDASRGLWVALGDATAISRMLATG